MSFRMSEYLSKNIVHLLNRRQLGLPLKENGRCVRHNRNNYRCDYELLKTLLSDRNLYLEVIAGRRVSRSDQPSLCHNRLFTHKYQSWFNLCTSPTAGPLLMKKNIFAPDESSSHDNFRLRIIDAVMMDPPNGLTPLPNSQHLRCILFLCKDGWVHQYCLEDASFLNKFYIATRFFADELYESYPNGRLSLEIGELERSASLIDFSYQYITVYGDEGKVLVRSAVADDYVAYALLGLFPLRLISHFITRSSSGISKAELWNDIFVVTGKAGSTVSLYSLEDVIAAHRIDMPDVHLGKAIICKESANGGVLRGEIGDIRIGLPYTMKVIELGTWKEWRCPQLFSAKVIKHILRIGGVPFHYAIPADRNCTSWSLRSFVDKKEIYKFHVDIKWDNSHAAGFDFHPDDTGRILLINKDTVTVYKIEQIQKSKAGTNSENEILSPPVTSSKDNPVEINSTGHTGKTNFQLRVIGPLHGPLHSAPPKTTQPTEFVKFGPKVVKCFEIRVNQKEKSERTVSTSSDEGEEVDVEWHYPSEANHIVARSSYGRTLRRTQHYDPNRPEFGVLCVSYENELDILAVLHLKVTPDMPPSYGIGEAHYDLAVSLYDNVTGAKINSVVVERDLTPSDTGDVGVIMDEDTIIYTRTEMPNSIYYKIMRFCRKY